MWQPHGQHLLVYPDPEQPWVLQLLSSCVGCCRREYVCSSWEKEYFENSLGLFQKHSFDLRDYQNRSEEPSPFRAADDRFGESHVAFSVDLSTEKYNSHRERALSKADKMDPHCPHVLPRRKAPMHTIGYMLQWPPCSVRDLFSHE